MYDAHSLGSTDQMSRSRCSNRFPNYELVSNIDIAIVFVQLCAYDAHNGGFMKSRRNLAVRKRPVNLTLNEDLVEQAKAITGNLSGVVESLLADFVEQERKHQLAKAQAIESTVAAWNDFNTKNGSFADEYSSL
jgi:antitoxin CcdA